MTKRIEINPAPEPLEAYLRHFDDLLGKSNQREGFRTLPKPMEEELEIQVYEPSNRLVVSGGFANFQGVTSYVLDSLGNTTKLTNEIELHASGALGPPAALTTPSIKSAIAQNLTVLKALLESTDQ
jgi:hypothetical protein